MNIRHVALIVLLALSSATVFAENRKKQEIVTPDAPAALGAYSQGVCFRDLCFLAGQIPLEPDGKFVECFDESGNPIKCDITAQTDRVMQNIGAILEAAGLDFCDVVNSTVSLADLGDFGGFNQTYISYFDGCEILPARATVGAAIPLDAKLEIAVIAAKQRGR
jgi:2-iminobutanoate/2-iminopropanoate deaminase